ncbi:MAG: sulfite exporter TauE/SafE family protein [Dehalococcoidales bacterium]
MLAAIGLFIGAFGTLIGVAGGFLLIPILLFMYPDYSPTVITSITLTVAFFNAVSGSIAYYRLKRIDFKSGLLFALTAVPGAILGAYLVNYLSRSVFQYIFGGILLAISVFLMLRPTRKAGGGFLRRWPTSRQITDRQNTVHRYTYNLPLGMTIAFFVGVISGLLGIGGGIVHVPALTQILNFPAHIATATSHFMVAITTFSAIDTHLIARTFTGDFGVAAVLSGGAVVGAQFGARLSQKVSGVLIVRLLAGGLAIVALRLLISPL